jgi:hypothetical protein
MSSYGFVVIGRASVYLKRHQGGYHAEIYVCVDYNYVLICGKHYSGRVCAP